MGRHDMHVLMAITAGNGSVAYKRDQHVIRLKADALNRKPIDLEQACRQSAGVMAGVQIGEMLTA